MNGKRGRPFTDENPKTIKFQFRMDSAFLDTLDFCARELKVTRSEIVRLGIQLVYKQITSQKCLSGERS